MFHYPTAGRAALGLALAAGTTWCAASSVAAAPVPAPQVVRLAATPGGQAGTPARASVRIGEAVAYVRDADGTIRRVR